MSEQEQYTKYMRKVKSSFDEAKANIESVYDNLKDKGYSEHELEFKIKMKLDDICSDFVSDYALTYGGENIQDVNLRIKSMYETNSLVKEIINYPSKLSRSSLNPSNKSI